MYVCKFYLQRLENKEVHSQGRPRCLDCPSSTSNLVAHLLLTSDSATCVARGKFCFALLVKHLFKHLLFVSG